MPNTIRSKFFLSLWGRSFVVAFVFVTFASGLFWLDFFRGYQGELVVLIVAQPGMSEASDDVAENMMELTRTLTFYDRVLADNDLIDDAFSGYAPDARKAKWQSIVSVERQRESGVLVIRAEGDTPEEAKRLARQTAETLFTVAGFYYDVKKEIDMRIVDGPLASYALDDAFLFAGTSVFSGLALTGIFFWLLRIVPGFFGRQARRPLFPSNNVSDKKAPVVESIHPEFAAGATVPWIDPKKFVPAKPEKLAFENMFQHTIQPVSMTEARPVTYAPAPINLPTADDETMAAMDDGSDPSFVFEEPSEESSEEKTANQQAVPRDFPVRGEHAIQTVPVVSDASPSVLADRERAEPTVDEYKRRLNALLSGGR